MRRIVEEKGNEEDEKRSANSGSPFADLKEAFGSADTAFIVGDNSRSCSGFFIVDARGVQRGEKLGVNKHRPSPKAFRRPEQPAAHGVGLEVDATRLRLLIPVVPSMAQARSMRRSL